VTGTRPTRLEVSTDGQAEADPLEVLAIAPVSVDIRT